MSFTILEISRIGNEVRYGLYLDPAADPGTAGIESFQFDLVFDASDLVWVSGSATYPAGFTALTNQDNAGTGTVILGGFSLAGWTTFTDPIATFKFNVASADVSENILLDNVELDGIPQADENLTIWTDNSAPTGSVTITGTATEGLTLNAANTLADGDGLGTITYNWYASGSGTAIGTGSSYLLKQADVGKTITVIASYTDGDGKLESKSSAPTAAVANGNSAPVGYVVTISGTTAEDSLLTASASVTSDDDGLPDPLNFTYQWQSSTNGTTWSNIGGATGSTFTPGDNQAGKFVRVIASYIDVENHVESKASAATAAITNVNDAPVGFTASISGTIAEDQMLTASAGVTSDGDGLPVPLNFSYQWQSSTNGSTWGDIVGATSVTFTPGDDEVGKFLRVIAKYTDGQGTLETVESAASIAVNAAPTGTVTITGTATEDQTLTASNTLADVDGLGAITYTWYASGSGTPLGVGPTYTLTQAEVGKTITVVASYTDGAGKPESMSSLGTAAVINVNDAPVGFSASISGTAQEDTQLTASAIVTSDEDGLPVPLNFTFKWQSSGDGSVWADIVGATGSTFTPGQLQVSKFIRVVATYTDAQGTPESSNSAATAAVANVNDAPAGTVIISGTAGEDQTLSASNTLADEDGLGPVTYTWYASGSGTPIGTGPNYTLTQAEVGKTITVQASYTDGFGNAESVSSVPTVVVTNVNDAPVGFTASISGAAQEDTVLTASAGVTSDEDGLPVPLNFSYQWQSSSDGSVWGNLLGATDSLFTPGQSLVGKFIRVQVTYTDQQGTAETTSSAATAAVSNINDAPTGAVLVTGTAGEDQTLTASNTLADEDGLGPITYTWYASGSGTPIGSGSAYILTQAEVGKTITVQASYTDGFGNAESVSSTPTAVVTNVNDVPVGFTASVTGTAQEDSVLTANASVASDEDGLPGPLTFSFQWQSSSNGSTWGDIVGANLATFSPGQAQVGRFVRVVASYTDQQGTAESTVSAATVAVANINDAPLNFTVDITGSKSEGQTLAVAVGEAIDEDGVGAFSYQWQRSNDSAGFDDIPGATTTQYTLVGSDVGRQMRVKVTYVDGQGTTETSFSLATSLITNTNDLPVGLPFIVGDLTEGQTVIVDLSAISDGDGLPDVGTFTYQWQRSIDNGANWSSISGATGPTRTLDNDDSSNLVRVVVTYTDNGGTEESLVSVGQTVTDTNDIPTGSVLVTGTLEQGQTLSVTNTLADADGLGVITYSWFASGSGTAIGTGPQYTLTQAEVGKTVRAVATYTDGNGNAESVSSAVSSAVTNINDLPIGTVTITGSATQGQTLTAAHTLTDADGLGTITFTWYASGSATPLSTGANITLTQAQVGKTITVVASYTDALGTAESVASAPTTAVANVNDLPTGSVTVSGTAAAGETLTVNNTLADVDGLGTISYTWYASGSATPVGTGATLALTEAEAGKTITAVASYTDGQGTAESVASTATGVVAGLNNPPTGNVIIVGDARIGSVLTAYNNLVDPDGLGRTINYQWLANGIAINGATTGVYLPVQGDLGKTITVIASYIDGEGFSEDVTSAPSTAVVNANVSPTGAVTISGAVSAGQTLTASNTLADADGVGSITYTWYASGSATPLSTGSTYTLTDAELGKTITVVASYIDGLGAAESVSSNPTTAVDNAGELIQGTPGPDTLVGGARDDTLVGFAGKDFLRGNAGDDVMQGGSDIDTAIYDGSLANYALVRNGNEISVSGPLADGNDLLVDVERLAFNDLSLAFDIDGNAGQVARLLGVMIGKDDWYIREYVGIGLDILDNEGITFEALMGLALDAVMGPTRTNEAVFSLLYQNIVGAAPSAEDIAVFVALLNDGTYTQASLAVAAAEHVLNEENIGLVGLAATGLEYLPV